MSHPANDNYYEFLHEQLAESNALVDKFIKELSEKSDQLKNEAKRALAILNEINELHNRSH